MKIAIGDPITTELVAKLPYTVMKSPEIACLSPKEKDALKRNLQDIENVRPFSATLDWLFYQVHEQGNGYGRGQRGYE